MFLLSSILFGLVLAVILGGKPARLADLCFRWPYLVVAALGVQLLLFTRAGAFIPEGPVRLVHLRCSSTRC